MPILTPASPKEIELILECHQIICLIAVKLSAIDISTCNLNEDAKRRFLDGRFWFDEYKRRLEWGLLTVIVCRLKALEPEIIAATHHLEKELQEINDFNSVLLLIEKVVLLVSQVIINGQPL